MSELQIGKKKIGNGYPVYIIAEGCDNHMGDVEVAKEMCRQAKLAGACLLYTSRTGWYFFDSDR